MFYNVFVLYLGLPHCWINKKTFTIPVQLFQLAPLIHDTINSFPAGYVKHVNRILSYLIPIFGPLDPFQECCFFYLTFDT